MNLRKFSFMVSVVLLLSVLLSACAGAAPTAAPDKPADSSGGAATGGEKVLKLGAAISETGQVSREGKFLKDGYEFWKDTVNAAGGVDIGGAKYKVEIVYYDDKSEPQTSAKLTEKLITEDKVDFILGPYSSGINIATAAISEKYKVLSFAPLANATNIYTQGYKYVFSILPPATRYLVYVLDMAVTLDPKPTTVALMARDDPFGISVAEGVKKHAEELGLKVVYYEKFPKNTTDVSALLTQVKELNPDILIATTLYQDAILITKQAKELKVCPKILSYSVGTAIPDFTKELGPDANFIFGAEWWLPNMGWEGPVFPTASGYAKDFEAKYGYVPGYHSAAGTATGLLLQLALEKAGEVNSDKVREELLKFKEQTFWGPIAWDETGQNISGASGVIQIQDGKVTAVFPDAIQQAKPIYPMPCWDNR